VVADHAYCWSAAWGVDHPPNKGEMARRLALQMLHTGYALQQQWSGSLRFASPEPAGFAAVNGQTSIGVVDWTAAGLHAQAVSNCTTCCKTSPFEVRP